jgi:hypothetical protein
MMKKSEKNSMNMNMKCPVSGKACINCALYRGRHYNICFQDHYRGDDRKGTGPIISMGYLASARIVKRSQCSQGT